MDGSQKLPQRLLGTIRDRLRAGAPFDHLALGVAAWMRYVTGIDEKGKPIDVRDPLAGPLRGIADRSGPIAQRLAPALIAVEQVFGSDLASDPRFIEVVTKKLAGTLLTGGIKVGCRGGPRLSGCIARQSGATHPRVESARPPTTARVAPRNIRNAS